TLPTGLTATAIAGTGWTCTQPGGPCTRSDGLAVGSSYPPITLTVNVAGNAAVRVTNTASAAGGGDPTNASADDLSYITAPNGNVGTRSTGSYWGAGGEQIDL